MKTPGELSSSASPAAPEDGITGRGGFTPPVTQKAIILHPLGRTIQSITVISFDPLAPACLCQRSNKFNLYHTLIQSKTNTVRLWWNDITQNKSERWVKICFPIELVPEPQKAFHTLKEELGGGGGSGRLALHPHHCPQNDDLHRALAPEINSSIHPEVSLALSVCWTNVQFSL